MKTKPFLPGNKAGRIFVFLLAIGLLASSLSPVQAQDEEPEGPMSHSETRLMQVVEQFEKQGFSRLGPLHVTRGPGDGVVDFYRHSPVRYDEIRILDQKGERVVLDTNVRVYLLQKDSRVILIRLNREDRSDVH